MWLNRYEQGRFVNETSKKILEKRGHQSSTADAVKPLDAEVAKKSVVEPVVEEGFQNADKTNEDAKVETQSSQTLVPTADQPLPTTEASTPTSLSKPTARAKAGRLSTVIADKSDKKRITSANEVILIDFFKDLTSII